MIPAVLWTLADWADAVAALPAEGPLPLRTVLVPREHHAHALRRHLLRTGRGGVLAGTRFAGAVALAAEVLRAAEVDFEPGEGALRPARLLALFGERLPLEYFDPELLRRTRGWDEAFASAIGDLEGAGLLPDELPGTTAQWRDVALLWRRLDAAAGRSWTAARVLREAATRLEGGRDLPGGTVLAAATGDERAVHARFLRALPGARLALLAARPLRDRHLARVEALHGEEARRALASARPPAAGATERDLLSRFLFASPEELGGAARPRSAGPDGTVQLEEHAGVEAEVEAAADWVGRQVLDGTPLEEIAVLVPFLDPLAGLVAERLARLPFRGGALPVHVAGGLPATSLAGGARALALVRALSAHLSAEPLAAALPGLRAEVSAERKHLTHGEAVELAWSLGTTGGNAAHPAGALEWSPRAAGREAELADAVGRARREGPGDSTAREASHLERTLARLRAIRPALDALAGVARGVVGNAPLPDVARTFSDLVEGWLLEPPGSAPVAALLAESLAAIRADAVASSLRGQEALEVVARHLLGLRVTRGRFGEPAVFVGRLADAAGLDFAAVRVVGLGEGALPPAVRQDPVLPDAMREEAGGPGKGAARVPTSADRVLAELHAFDRVVRGARRSLALSAPRLDLERTEREPSSIFVEVGAALGRPDAATGRPAGTVPDLKTLRRDAFAPARADAAAFRRANPLSRSAWLDRAALLAEVPPSWTGEGSTDLDRVERLRALGSSGDLAGAEDPFPVLPGLAPERPISASALADLLRCPRFFLYRRVLGWDEPAGPPPLGELDPLSYGGLFHAVVEDFYRRRGADFVAGRGSLEGWRREALEIADRRFREFLSAYPLVGEGLREKERRRLREDVRSFLDYDWSGRAGRRFVDVERPFGDPRPVELDAGGVPLHVRGYIDRLDVEGDHVLVRDLKTGRPHPRSGAEAGPTPVRDVQLALYGIVTRKLAAGWGLPAKVEAAYAYAGERGERERAFRGDFSALEEAGAAWLAHAARVLRQRAFAPTPDEGSCAWCFFRPLCGAEAPAPPPGAQEGG